QLDEPDYTNLEESNRQSETQPQHNEPELVNDDIQIDDSELLEEQDEDYTDYDSAKHIDKPSYLSDPRNKETTYKSSSYADGDKPKQSLIATLLIAALILYAGNYLLYKITGYSFFGYKSDESVIINYDNTASII